nr:elongation factor P [endosymbiont of Acanthamoeba sp. UWC8]
MMKIDANSIRVGDVLEYNGKLWVVQKTMHTQPGKGGAYMQVEMKDMINGTKLNHRFRSSENIEKVRLDQKKFQFLYMEGDNLALMDNESYEQIYIDKEIVGEQVVFLQDGMEVNVEFYEDKPLTISLPETLVVTVKECEPVVKGQTAASSYKPAILENGVRVMVPPFISMGEKIVIKTAEIEYLERAKD